MAKASASPPPLVNLHSLSVSRKLFNSSAKQGPSGLSNVVRGGLDFNFFITLKCSYGRYPNKLHPIENSE